MKRKTLCRALAILCLLSVLAACARESAPAETSPANMSAAVAASPGPDAQETRDECLRLISNCLRQNKSRLPLYGILSLDREIFFADYDGGAAEVLAAEPDGQRQNSPLRTDSVYYWRDDSGEATPPQAARELVTLMLTHYQELPESERKLTVTEYSVGEQKLYSWEELPLMIGGSDPFASIIENRSYDAAVAEVRSRLARETQDAGAPFAYIDLAVALGEYMWVLAPACEAKYEGAVERREESGDAFILMCDGNVWRMQRAGAMEKLFADAPFIRRMSGYTLEQLELSMIEDCNENYIEGASSEYLRRAALDPEGTAARMDTLGFPRLAHLCRALSYRGEEAELLASVDGSYAAGLLGKYIEFEKGERGESGRTLPPATGMLCPALLYDGMKVGVGPRLNFVNDKLLVFCDYSGMFVYDFEQGEMVFSADLITAMGWRAIQGSHVVVPLVDSDGRRIRLAYYEEGWDDYYLVRYEIDTSDWSWKYVEYELSYREAEKLDIFTFDPDADYGEFGCKPANGWVSDRLSDLVYIRGDGTVRLFDGVDFSAARQSVPVPSGDLE